MSDVFISYKAEDRARLRPLVAALQADGLSVWWDAEIGGGEQWREAIERELDAAYCVIVAWTARSVAPEGRFVRDEASRAQRRGVYLPLKLDKVDPPLGFGETQALSLIGWRGRREDERYQAVLEAVRAVIDPKHAKPAAPVAAKPAALSRYWLYIAVAPALIGSSALIYYHGRGHSDAGDKIYLAIEPFKRLSADLPAALPERLEAELGQEFQSDPVLPIEVVNGTRSPEANYRLSGSISRSQDNVRFLLTLQHGGTTLASFPLEFATTDENVLPQQPANFAASVLRCGFGLASKAAPPTPLDVQQLIFRHCSTDVMSLPRLETARQLTKKLPTLADAWAARAIAAADLYDARQGGSGRGETIMAADKALRLNVRNSTAYLALATVQPALDYAAQEKLLMKAVDAEPMTCGCEYASYGDLLLRTGRIEAAVEKYKAASDILPMEPSHAVGSTAAYRMIGRIDESNRIASLFRATWPQFMFHRRLLQNALQLHQAGVVRSVVASSAKFEPASPDVGDAIVKAAEALQSGNKTEQLKAGDRIEALSRDPATNGGLIIELLGLFGRDDAAAKAMEQAGKADPSRVFQAYAPEMAGARRKPEIERLFRDLKLTEYWRSSGNRPDFCKSEHIPAFCS